MADQNITKNAPLSTITGAGASLAAAKTYWAHDPYAAPDSDNARIADISRTFIKLFYESLLKQKCRVVTGVEIESSFKSEKDDTMEDAITYLSDQLVKPGDNTPFGRTKNKHGESIATKRNGIYRIYEDGDTMEITTWPRKPIETVAYVRGIKKMLVESTNEFAELAPDHTLSPSAAKYKAALADLAKNHESDEASPPITRLRFGKAKKSDDKTVLESEHMNISLHRTSEDTDSQNFDLAAVNKTQGELGYLLGEILTQQTKADNLLLQSSPASIKRYQDRFEKSGTKQYTQVDRATSEFFLDKGHELPKGAADRVEWSGPDSASDIHATMLTAMSSTYALMHGIKQATGAVILPQTISRADRTRILDAVNDLIPQAPTKALSQQDRVQQFQEHSMVLKMMKQVVKENVPEAEQEKYTALISEFEAAAIRQSNRQMAPNTEISNAR